MDYQEQYQNYLAQAMAALEKACGRFLPEESEVCRAARYSLMGGGKRIRAVLVLSVCDMLGGSMQAKVSPCSIRCQLDQQQLSQTVYLEVPAQMYLVHDAQVLVGRPEVSQRDGRTEIRVPVAVSLCGADAAGHLKDARRHASRHDH